MKKLLLAAAVALGAYPSYSYAQLDLGGAISGAINQATGATQAGAQAGAQTGLSAGGQAGVSGGQVGVPGGQVGVPGGQIGIPGARNLGGQVGGEVGANVGGNIGSALGGSGNLGSRIGAGIGANVGNNVGAGAGLNSGTTASGNLGTNQGWFGALSNDLRSSFQPGTNGALQLQGNLNPSLQQYGFRPGDQLIGANGQVLTQAQFDQYLQSNPNQVRVMRNGQIVVLGGGRASMGGYGQSGSVYGGSYGGAYAQGSPSGRPRLGITMDPNSNGVIVASVAPGSPAAQIGLRPGDQIVAVNGQGVNNPNEMIQLVGQADINENLNLEYSRNGQVMQGSVLLASNAGAQGDVRQAGYGQPQEYGQAGGDLHRRIEDLERMVQELRDEVRRLSGGAPADPAPAQPDAPSPPNQ